MRSYPESNRGRPDSPDTLQEERGIRTGSDNRYTIEPFFALILSVQSMVQLTMQRIYTLNLQGNCCIHREVDQINV